MQISLNLGKVDINDIEVANFIQNKSIDEIKTLFVNLLKNQVHKNKIDISLDNRLRNLKIIDTKKEKRVRKAFNSLNKKLEPMKNIDLEIEKNRYLKEKFSL